MRIKLGRRGGGSIVYYPIHNFIPCRPASVGTKRSRASDWRHGNGRLGIIFRLFGNHMAENLDWSMDGIWVFGLLQLYQLGTNAVNHAFLGVHSCWSEQTLSLGCWCESAAVAG